jgi:hypothetical protein
MIKRISLILMAALALFGTVQTSQAVLTAVDPGPYTAKYGFFPTWYQDATAPGVPPAAPPSSGVLELCLSQTVGPNGAMCTLLPPPTGVGFDPALPVVFPLNFPDEAFYFSADTTITDATTGIDLTYVAALEAAFAIGPVVDGDQITFARIRLRVDVPVAGTYIITHPYGTKTYNVTIPGRRAINDTVDIGIGAPGNFTGALGGAIGPFLTAATGLITVGTEQFVGDPNILQTVVGSPFGTNFVRIQGPGGINLTTTQFTLMGKLFDGKLATPLAVDRSTYSRTLTASQIDAFATSTATATVSFQDGLADVAATPMLGDGAGKFYAQELDPLALPTHLIVTATDPTAVPATTANTLASQLVDVVKITRAVYALDTQTLTIVAASSDEVSVPTLTALGFGDLLVEPGNTLQSLIVTPPPNFEPPATVTVKSSAGGADTEPVVIIPTAVNQAPVAANDTAFTAPGVAVTINVLANDLDTDGPPPLAINAFDALGTSGGAVVQVGSQLQYTPPSPVFTGTDTFTYSAKDAATPTPAVSNTATVSVHVAVNQAPVAVNDTATTSQATPVLISVLANDTDPDGPPPIAINTFTQGTIGAVVQVGSQLRYTPFAGLVGSDSFSYTARDGHGAVSNQAIVTVTVTNQLPVANPDAASTPVNGAVIITVLGNDTDPEGNLPLAVASVGAVVPPTAGSVTNNGTSVTFNAGATAGTATFTYVASDSLGALSAPATVTVTITPPPNLPPVAVNDAATTNQATPVTINVLANDSDPNGNPITIANFTQPANGRVRLAGTQLTYTPPRGFSGVATFTYRIADSLGALSNFATVRVTVRATTITATATARITGAARNRANWVVTGSTTAPAGTNINVRVRTPGGIRNLGSTPVTAAGTFRLAVTNSGAIPRPNNPIATVLSVPTGVSINVPVTVR